MHNQNEKWNLFIGNGDGKGLIRVEVDGTGEHVCSLPRGVKNAARGKLIAAAPTLFMVLSAINLDSGREVLGTADYDIRMSAGFLNQLRAALALATGEEAK